MQQCVGERRLLAEIRGLAQQSFQRMAGGKRFEGRDEIADPVVVAGDFNSHGVGARLLARGFLWPTRHIGHSIGPFSYDHIFVRGLRLAEAPSAGVAKAGPRASDHWPVWGLFVPEPATSPGPPS